jgi:hypothetical protein
MNTTPAKPFQGRKEDATPEQWAAHLAYRREYTKRPEQAAKRRARKEWKKYRAKHPGKARTGSPEKRREYDARYKREQRKKFPNLVRSKARERNRKLSPEAKARKIERNREYERRKLKEDPQYAVTKSIRCRMFLALRRGWKAGRTVELLGCSVSECLSHLESKFLPGMTWGNWGSGKGNSTWHIDHITPVSAFDLTNEQAQKACFHYTNLQPMWGSDNIRKGGASSTVRSTPSST